MFCVLDSLPESLSRHAGALEDQKLLSAVLSWEYRDCARLCSSCIVTSRFLEMAVAEDSSPIHDRQGHSRDTCVDAYAHQ